MSLPPVPDAFLVNSHDAGDAARESRSWLRWVPTSMKALVEAERRLFLGVKTAILGRFVPVRFQQGQVWTISVGGKKEDTRAPLVLVHGFGGGVGLWARNLDDLAAHRRLHALDLLGFGRSSRVKFSQDATLAEAEWVASIEDWRRQMGIEQMVLLGHSLGGFLAAAYAIEHPERVRHLILTDPWGMPPPPPPGVDRLPNLPTWVRAVARIVSVFNPLSGLRAAGPWGPGMVRRFRPDLGRRFASEEDGTDESAVYDYIFHCNAQTPAGEAAFKSLNENFGWAKRPMAERIVEQLDAKVPLSFLYGGRSWMDSATGYQVQAARGSGSYVHVGIVEGAGHHVYADRPDDFNAAIDDISRRVDEDEDRVPQQPA